MTVKNPNYKKFLEHGFVEYINVDQLSMALKNVKGIYNRYVKEFRSFLIVLYYTGARPAEALKLVQGQIYKHGNHCVIKMPGSKRGVYRLIYISFKRRHIKEMYDYCWNNFPGIKLFPHLIGKYKREYLDKDGKVRHYVETTYKVRYYMYKWFEGVVDYSINPYFLRHSKFSKMSEKGADAEDIKQLKGSKTLTSVEPYMHLSSKRAKKLARLND